MDIMLVAIALAAGVTLPTQAGINARLAAWCNEPVLASLISFFVGTMGLVAYIIATRTPVPAAASWGEPAWWHWTGGLLGAFFVTATVLLAPRLGATTMVALIIAGQMLASVILDHFGYLGYAEHPLNLPRFVGVVLIVVGVFLVRRY